MLLLCCVGGVWFCGLAVLQVCCVVGLLRVCGVVLFGARFWCVLFRLFFFVCSVYVVCCCVVVKMDICVVVLLFCWARCAVALLVCNGAGLLCWCVVMLLCRWCVFLLVCCSCWFVVLLY